jgi:CBS domain-containing protein
MLFPIEQLLKNKNELGCILKNKTVRDALTQMAKNDYSQLPVLDETGSLLGMITEQSIISTYFHSTGAVSLLELSVDHCLTRAATLSADSDIFEALDILHNVYAIVITENQKPIGILTDYDTTHFFRDLSEGLILIEDIETTLRQYIQHTFDDDETMQAALMRAFRADRRDPSRPAREFETLSFGQHIQMITTEGNWEKFAPYFEPRVLFTEFMDQVRQIRNQLAHFRGQLEPIQFSALIRVRDWLGSRPKPLEMQKKSYPQVEIKSEEIVQTKKGGKYDPLQSWLEDQRADGKTNLRVSFQNIGKLLEDELPESARKHRSWWANEMTSHVQAAAWLKAGWLVEDVDFETNEVSFRQSVSALYPPFFTSLWEQFKVRHPGITQAVGGSTQNWLSIGGGQSGLTLNWVLPREPVFRVELFINTGDKVTNKDYFEKLTSRRNEIEEKLGIVLNWDRLENNKPSRIAASIPFKITQPPEDHEKAKEWGIETMSKFIEVFIPTIKAL